MPWWTNWIYKILTGYQLLLLHRCYSTITGLSSGVRSAKVVLQKTKNGWYLAAKQLLWHWKFLLLWICSFPWWKYRISKPSQGIDGMFQATYSPRRKTYCYISITGISARRGDVSGTGGKVIVTGLSSQAPLQACLYAGSFHAALRSITIIFASRWGRLSLKENKAGNVPSPVLILFPVFIPYKVLISIRTITIPGFMLPKKDCFIHFILLLLFIGRVFVILLVMPGFEQNFMFLVKFGQTVYRDR